MIDITEKTIKNDPVNTFVHQLSPAPRNTQTGVGGAIRGGWAGGRGGFRRITSSTDKNRIMRTEQVPALRV